MSEHDKTSSACTTIPATMTLRLKTRSSPSRRWVVGSRLRAISCISKCFTVRTRFHQATTKMTRWWWPTSRTPSWPRTAETANAHTEQWWRTITTIAPTMRAATSAAGRPIAEALQTPRSVARASSTAGIPKTCRGTELRGSTGRRTTRRTAKKKCKLTEFKTQNRWSVGRLQGRAPAPISATAPTVPLRPIRDPWRARSWFSSHKL